MTYSHRWFIISYWEEMKRYSTSLNFEQKYRFIQYVSKVGVNNA